MILAVVGEVHRIDVNMLAAQPRSDPGQETRDSYDSLRESQQFFILGVTIADHPSNRADFIKKDGEEEC